MLYVVLPLAIDLLRTRRGHVFEKKVGVPVENNYFIYRRTNVFVETCSLWVRRRFATI